MKRLMFNLNRPSRMLSQFNTVIPLDLQKILLDSNR